MAKIHFNTGGTADCQIVFTGKKLVLTNVRAEVTCKKCLQKFPRCCLFHRNGGALTLGCSGMVITADDPDFA